MVIQVGHQLGAVERVKRALVDCRWNDGELRVDEFILFFWIAMGGARSYLVTPSSSAHTIKCG